MSSAEAVVSPENTYVYRFETKPRSAESTALIAQIRKYASLLCKDGQLYFSQSFALSGSIWMLHKDDTAGPPRMQTVLAIAFTDSSAYKDDAFEIRNLCRAMRGTPGAGKVLFDVIAKHAAASGCTFLTLQAAEKKLERVYAAAFGMHCPDFMCTLRLNTVPRAFVPEWLSVSLHQLDLVTLPPLEAASKKRKARPAE